MASDFRKMVEDVVINEVVTNHGKHSGLVESFNDELIFQAGVAMIENHLLAHRQVVPAITKTIEAPQLPTKPAGDYARFIKGAKDFSVLVVRKTLRFLNCA